MCLLFQRLSASLYAYFISHYHRFFSILTFKTTWQTELPMRDFQAEKTNHKMLRRAALVLLRLKMMLKTVQTQAKSHPL